jgi:predicted TIM-barrel fold metal-dependent hydrolase
MCRTYNDWLAAYCSEDPSRLIGIGLAPVQDPALAVKEMDRAVNALGFRGIMIRPAPYIGSVKFNDPVYDPIWDTAQALGVPIGVHPFSFADMPFNVVSALRLQDDTGGNASKGLTIRQGLGNAIDVMVTMGYFVAGGICERFPQLKVVFLEGSGGWASPMLERFDHHMGVFGSRHQKTKPSEVFKRQCWISFDPDEHALAYTARSPYVGADRIIWASDYPHPDAKFPGVVDELLEAAEKLDPDEQKKIVGENAALLYGIS